MARRKIGVAAGKMPPDAEAVKTREHPPEEKPLEESEAEKVREHPPEGKPIEEPRAEKTKEPSPEEKSTGEPGAEEAEESEAEKAGEPTSEEKPIEEPGAEKGKEPSPEEKLSEESEAGLPAVYKIICRNKITKRIGGVDFTEGEGYTTDGFAASWFAVKDGYTVEPVEWERLW